MLDLRTNREKKRDELHERVCEAYRNIRSEAPDNSHHWLCTQVAEQMDLTRAGVDAIVTRHGLYTRKATPTT